MIANSIAPGMDRGRAGRLSLPALALPIESPARFPTTTDGRSAVPNWMDQAIVAYEARRDRQEAELRDALVSKLLALTGRPIGPEDVYVNAETRTAHAVVDGVHFRLRHDELVLLRPCAYCGTGTFASDGLSTKADLGYALETWQPLHHECQWDDSE